MQIVQCDKHRRDAEDLEIARRIRGRKINLANQREWLRRAKQAIDRRDFDMAINLIDRARMEQV